MGVQTLRKEALADLHKILFRPSAGIFDSKPFVKQKSFKPGKICKINSKLYSSIARSFLEEKEPCTKNYYKSPTLKDTCPGTKGTKYYGDILEDALLIKSAKDRLWPKRKICELQGSSPIEPTRKGVLPADLVKTIWGPTPKQKPRDDEKREAEVDELIRKLRKKKVEADNKFAECLMDVLLRNWVYFEHSHESVKYIDNHVHAKYCETDFGHYLLADGTQIHGSYIISLRQLITELKALMAKLKAKVIHSTYKEMPVWRSPPLEEINEFCPPEQKAMPQLYPIEGLLPIPEDDIPADVSMPLLRTPKLQSHPQYTPPKFERKAAILSLPPLQDFSIEERSLETFKEIPAPIFKMPELLPLPQWQEPQEIPLPSMPINEEAKFVEPPEQEVIPPYVIPTVEPRPCEASYYVIEQGKASICDGLCGRKKGPKHQDQYDQYPCLAQRPQPMSLPPAPIVDVIPDPPFHPPPVEFLPPFFPPALKPEPKYVGPSKPKIPEWSLPPPPDPIGYLAGQRPVFLVDCSATMAGERMTCALEAMRFLFSKGGQVEVAATHFDIIMYSFDAWSYGALEEERLYKLTNGASHHWVKNLEFMQPKTPENMEKALTWMSRWSTGGTSNIKKAIEVAMQRTSADCIYIFTHGKCDRPVIIMNTLKELQLEKRQGLTPIYPIGLEPTKTQARILKNILADITGGQYRELDLQWQYKLGTKHNNASEDVSWLGNGVEYWQRKGLREGAPEPIERIMEHLKRQFDVERRAPLLAICEKEEELAKLNHKILFNAIQEENRRITTSARESYEKTHGVILERNKQVFERAKKLWEEEVQRVRALNALRNKSYMEWQTNFLQIEYANKKSEEDGQRKFWEEIKKIEEIHAYKMSHGKDEHDELVKRLKEKNEFLTRNHIKRQRDVLSMAKAKNEATWKAYEDKCVEIKALNAQNGEKAQAEFAAACEAITKENEKRVKEAEADHKWRFEAITNDNARRKSEFTARVQDLHMRKIEARKSHQERVSTLVAAHKASIASIVATNESLEQQAKRAWEEACKTVDMENKMVTEKTYQEWKEATSAVQVTNEQLAKRRAEFHARMEEVESMNNELVKKKKADWKQACHQMEKQFEEEVIKSRLKHEEYMIKVQIHNEQLLAASKIEHDAKVAAVKAYNTSIQPYVEESDAIQKEIDRIRAFLGYIVSQSHLPEEKNVNKKRTLDQNLDMLAALDSPCPPKVIIAALQAAYANDVQGKMFSETTPDKVDMVKPHATATTPNVANSRKRQHGKFSDMVAIQPMRANAHYCTGGAKLDYAKESRYKNKSKKSASTMVPKKQRDSAPMRASTLKENVK